MGNVYAILFFYQYKVHVWIFVLIMLEDFRMLFFYINKIKFKVRCV